jgi:hypothetical protein
MIITDIVVAARSSACAADETFDSIIILKKFLVHKMAIATL